MKSTNLSPEKELLSQTEIKNIVSGILKNNREILDFSDYELSFLYSALYEQVLSKRKQKNINLIENKNPDELVTDFVEKNYSEDSVNTVKQKLLKYVSHLGDHSIFEYNESFIKKTVDSITRSESGKRVYISLIKSFYKYLEQSHTVYITYEHFDDYASNLIVAETNSNKVEIPDDNFIKNLIYELSTDEDSYFLACAIAVMCVKGYSQKLLGSLKIKRIETENSFYYDFVISSDASEHFLKEMKDSQYENVINKFWAHNSEKPDYPDWYQALAEKIAHEYLNKNTAEYFLTENFQVRRFEIFLQNYMSKFKAYNLPVYNSRSFRYYCVKKIFMNITMPDDIKNNEKLDAETKHKQFLQYKIELIKIIMGHKNLITTKTFLKDIGLL